MKNDIIYNETNTYTKHHALCCSICLYPIEYFDSVEESFTMKAISRLNKYKISGRSLTTIFADSQFEISKCPNCKTKYIDLLDIDYNLAPLIYKLNSKGYYTLFCCSGHQQKRIYRSYYKNRQISDYSEDNESSYITFANRNVFIKYIIPNLPDNWSIDKYNEEDKYYAMMPDYIKCTIRSTRILGDPFNGYNDINDPGYSLNNMIEKLPDIKN